MLKFDTLSKEDYQNEDIPERTESIKYEPIAAAIESGCIVKIEINGNYLTLVSGIRRACGLRGIKSTHRRDADKKYLYAARKGVL